MLTLLLGESMRRSVECYSGISYLFGVVVMGSISRLLLSGLIVDCGVSDVCLLVELWGVMVFHACPGVDPGR